MKPLTAQQAAKLKPHPLAELLPMMSELEYQSLRDSIAAVGGNIEPIILLDGKILDGRHRYRACEELGLSPKTATYDAAWGDPVEYIYAKANHRNMTESQKATAAVKFLPHFEKLAISRMKSGGSGTGSQGSNGRARDHAGALFGVSGRYVADAKALLEADRKLFDEVFAGRLPLTQAKRRVIRAAKTKRLTAKAKAAGPLDEDACNIMHGDCLKRLPEIPSRSVALVFLDPPYNIGVDYGPGKAADRLSDQEYIHQIEQALIECHRILRPNGSLFLMCNPATSPDIEMILRGAYESPEFHRRNTIIWHETFGQYTPDNFTGCWRPIHYYTVSDDDFIWHGEQIVIPSDRQAKYGDSRADPAGKVPGNVWQFPRLVDNAADRLPGFPTQLPLALVERIVRVASEPGDLVCDPFLGSGTTAHAALIHGRRFVGCEKEKKNVAFARARVAAALAEMNAAPIRRKVKHEKG